MKSYITTHLLPLQPPFPLIYIGNPHYRVCRQIATLIQVNNESISQHYFSIPVVDSENVFHGFPYDKTENSNGKVVLLDIKAGDKLIPTKKIVDTLRNFDAPEEQMPKIIKNFAATLQNNGCSVSKPKEINIIASCLFQNEKLVSVLLQIPLLNIAKKFSPDIDENEFDELVEEIKMYWSVFDEFEVKYVWIKPDKWTDEIQKKKIFDKIDYLFAVNFGNYGKLSLIDYDDILYGLMNVDVKSFKDINDKSFIELAESCCIHYYEYQTFLNILIEKGWFVYDENTGCWKSTLYEADTNLQANTPDS